MSRFFSHLLKNNMNLYIFINMIGLHRTRERINLHDRYKNVNKT
jgi:hypothetical protein